MKATRYLLIAFFLLLGTAMYGQSKGKGTTQWVKVRDDQMATIYYDKNIQKNRRGNNVVWVKTIFHDPEWQNYMAEQIGSRVPVCMTKTKAEYDEAYAAVQVRQVMAYNKANKLLYDTGDGGEAEWGYVNASDPVGIVGEYLNEIWRDSYSEW